MDALTQQFHSIDGTTIQEKRRKFNLFLKSLESGVADKNKLTDFISSISPTNPTEELFKIEIIIQFKQYNLLQNGLKTNSPLLVKKLLKNWRIFTDFFSNINVNTFVHDILPHVSYSLKFKLVNGICKNIKNEPLLNEYFSALEKKYGIKIAVILLPGCSIELIKTKIPKFHSKLSNRHLISIFKKNKEFIEYYFDILQKKYANFNFLNAYKQTLMFVAKADAKLYWKLSEKYKFRLRFGKRMTTNIFRANNNVSLVYFIKYASDFCLRQLYKTTRKDENFKEILLNAFPNDHDQFSNTYQNYYFNRFINFLPKRELYSVITTIFKEKYEKNLLDYPEYCKDFIEIIPVKERENILDILVKKDEQLVYYYQTYKSIPIIKKRLQHSSDANTRAQLVIWMYKTCAVNRDKEALLDVLEFILNRYQNDINVISTFFNHIIGWPDVINLNEKYWKYITDMAKIIAVSKATFYHDNFYIKYICYLIESNTYTQEHGKELIKHMPTGFGFSDYKKYERKIIENLGECIPMYKEHEDYPSICINFLMCLINYNSRFTNPQISFDNYHYLFDQVRSKNCYTCQKIITFGLKNFNTEFWHNLFWNYQPNTIMDYQILVWYLKNRPEKIAENIDKVMERLNGFRMEVFLKEAEKLLDKDTSQKIKIRALNNLHSGDKDKINISFKIISILTPDALSEFVLPLLVSPDVQTNLKKFQDRLLYRTLIKNLHKLGEPLYIFPLIPKFCTRYNFKYALTPLQSVAYHTPELHIKRHLMQFSNKTVAIRKQVLILAKDLLLHEEYIKVLEEFCEIETNASLKNIIFMKTVKHFIENPCESLWTLTKKNLKLIDKQDRDVYKFLLKYENIPHEYLSDYIEIVFENFSNNIDKEIKKKRIELLDSIPSPVIVNMNTEFLKHVITETACLENTSNFHWKCVFDVHEKYQQQLFEENFRVLKNFVGDKHINSSNDSKIRLVITSFLRRFLNITLELKRCHNLVEKFIMTWTSIIQTNIICMDYAMLLFTDVYFKSDFDACQTGIKVNDLLDSYIKKYSASIIPSFSNHLTQFLEKIAKEEQEQIIQFIEGFSRNNYDENTYIIVLCLLSKISEINTEKVPVLKEIQECVNPIVRFYYDVYISDLKVKMNIL